MNYKYYLRRYQLEHKNREIQITRTRGKERVKNRLQIGTFMAGGPRISGSALRSFHRCGEYAGAN